MGRERLVTALLELDGVRAGFGSTTVLHGVDLALEAGEVAGVFGLNGAGKSVTMKVIAGIVPARGGRVSFAGRDVTTMEPEDRVALGMGHVPQGRQLRKRNPARYDELLTTMFERFPILAERRRQLAGSMSGGQQAALAVARALVSDPKLLLVDEPSAGLAPSVVAEVGRILREANDLGVTILLVEQNVTFGLGLVERAFVMQRGRVVYGGDVAELDQERVAGLLGVGRMLSSGVKATVAKRRTRNPKAKT